MSDTTIHGTPIYRESDDTIVAWRWAMPARYGITVHTKISWVRSTKKWVRATSISDTKEEGGWQEYVVPYAKANDEEEAWSIVEAQLNNELGREADYC